MAKADGVNPVEAALERLYGALGTVDGLLLVRGVGVRLDPPAAVVAPSRSSWETFGDAPTKSQFTAVVLVADTERAMAELTALYPTVAAALRKTAITVGLPEPGTWPAGGGVELPAYLFKVEVVL
jgi:hypothetical protein